MVAIVATGRYPRALFDFNVGVLRWTWRVGFYGYSALGTDRYPPFTLAPRGLPGRARGRVPRALSRGKALVKWWLLALPHYIVVTLLALGLDDRPTTWRAEPAGRARRLAAVRCSSPAATRATSSCCRRHQPLGAPGRRVRRADARRVPAVPARSVNSAGRSAIESTARSARRRSAAGGLLWG